MQFNFNCESALGCDSNGFAILEGSYQNRIVPGFTLFVNEILDTMGMLSAKSRQLSIIGTSAYKFFGSYDRIAIKAKEDKVLGFLKVGLKKLFLRDSFFNYYDTCPLCVLDFYVFDYNQRQGLGKELFDYMLMFEKKNPEELAYDRPNDKCLNFLRKHYGLVNFLRQNNGFIVFNEFFDFLSNVKNKSNLNTQIAYKNKNNIITPYYNNPNQNIIQSPSTNINNEIPQQEGIIYSNNYKRNIVDRNVYKNPRSAFQRYYLNSGDTNYYDNIYSKRKIDLINDYMSSLKQEESDYVREQIDMKEQSIENSNGRLNQLQNKISNKVNLNRRLNDELYNKRSHYATVFDDKKIIENSYYNQYLPRLRRTQSEPHFSNQNNIPNNIPYQKKNIDRFQHYSPFSQLGKVYTNVMPTTSSVYGAYYNNPSEFDIRNQSPNRLYY